jgi:di- and tripeptidase
MLLGQGILPDRPQEEILVSGGGDGRILLWQIEPVGGRIRDICTLDDGREEGESILSLAQEGSFLYSGRLDGEINVWDLETRQLVRSLKSNTGDVLALSLGGGHLFASGIFGKVQVGQRDLQQPQWLILLRNSINTTRRYRPSRRTMALSLPLLSRLPTASQR